MPRADRKPKPPTMTPNLQNILDQARANGGRLVRAKSLMWMLPDKSQFFSEANVKTLMALGKLKLDDWKMQRGQKIILGVAVVEGDR